MRRPPDHTDCVSCEVGRLVLGCAITSLRSDLADSAAIYLDQAVRAPHTHDLCAAIIHALGVEMQAMALRVRTRMAASDLGARLCPACLTGAGAHRCPERKPA